MASKMKDQNTRIIYFYFFFFFDNEIKDKRLIFFFSSRKWHTRSYGDWSSDVCSSDLARGVGEPDRKPRPSAARRQLEPRSRIGRAAADGREIGRASCRERV